MLYNITFRLWDESTRLIPYIPYSAAEDEDHETERVCFADSVEHCIQAIGPCDRDLHTDCLIVVRQVDETDLKPSKIVTDQELFDTKKVPDALENHEYWYLDEVDVVREVYRIKDFTFEYTVAFTCVVRDDLAALMEKYNPGSPIRKNETVEQAYNRTLVELYEKGMYEEGDLFESRVIELPWARKLKITGLVMEKVTTKEEKGEQDEK